MDSGDEAVVVGSGAWLSCVASPGSALSMVLLGAFAEGPSQHGTGTDATTDAEADEQPRSDDGVALVAVLRAALLA